MSFDPQSPDPYASSAANRTNLPGIFLIVVGAVNLLVGLYFVFNLLMIVITPAEELAKTQAGINKAFAEAFPAAKKELENQPKENPADLKRNQALMGGLFLALTLIPAIVTILAGVQMRSLRSYGLSIARQFGFFLRCFTKDLDSSRQ